MGLITGYFNLLSLDDGKPGATGAKCRMRLWTEGDYYLSGAPGEEWFDIVWMRDNPKQPYRCTKTITSSGKLGVNDPVTSIQKHLGIWQAAQNWAFIATELVLSRLIKASEIDADGIRAKNVDISGKITATEGFIGAFKIDFNGLSNVSDNPTAYINISDRTAQQSNWNGFSVNSDSDSFCLVHSISKNAISAVTHLGTALYASGGNFDTAEGYALRTEGNVYMQSDRLGRIELEGTMYLHSGQFGGIELGDNDDSRWIKEVKIKGLSLRYREIALNYQTINSNDDFILFTNKGNINVSLPTDVTPGKIFYLKKSTGYSVTIEGQFVGSNNKQSFENFNMTEASIELIKSKDKWVVFFCG